MRSITTSVTLCKPHFSAYVALHLIIHHFHPIHVSPTTYKALQGCYYLLIREIDNIVI